MAGALSMLSAAGCDLVGGHTCEGADLALGFSVTVRSHLCYAVIKFCSVSAPCFEPRPFGTIVSRRSGSSSKLSLFVA